VRNSQKSFTIHNVTVTRSTKMSKQLKNIKLKMIACTKYDQSKLEKDS